MKINMDDLESYLITQTCLKCYYKEENKDDYEIFAIIRSYNHSELDWKIHTLDSLLEASDAIEDISEWAERLRDFYEVIEEVPLVSFMSEFIHTSIELDRWGVNSVTCS